jgi:hypothetical protein
VIAKLDAVAPPELLSVRGFVSVVPATTLAGPDFVMETIGRCSIVVTAGGPAALTVPVYAFALADAVALSIAPSSAVKAEK